MPSRNASLVDPRDYRYSFKVGEDRYEVGKDFDKVTVRARHFVPAEPTHTLHHIDLGSKSEPAQLRPAIRTTYKEFGEYLGLTYSQTRNALKELAQREVIELLPEANRLVIADGATLRRFLPAERTRQQERKRRTSGTLLFRRVVIACERKLLPALMLSQIAYMCVVGRRIKSCYYATDAKFMEWFGVTRLQVQRARDYLKSRGLVRVKKRWVTEGKNTRRHLACHYFPDWRRMIELVHPEFDISQPEPAADESPRDAIQATLEAAANLDEDLFAIHPYEDDEWDLRAQLNELKGDLEAWREDEASD
jgi:hypothetical protein